VKLHAFFLKVFTFVEKPFLGNDAFKVFDLLVKFFEGNFLHVVVA
jgi:hypothetical protein